MCVERKKYPHDNALLWSQSHTYASECLSAPTDGISSKMWLRTEAINTIYSHYSWSVCFKVLVYSKRSLPNTMLIFFANNGDTEDSATKLLLCTFVQSNIYLMKKNSSPESGPEIWAESVSQYVNKEHQNQSYKSKKRVERRELQPMKVLLPCTKYAWFKVSVIRI